MTKEFYNSVWFEGTRVSELVSAFSAYLGEGKNSILEQKTANSKPSSEKPFYDITTYDDSIWFCSRKRPSVKDLKAICKEFECDFTLRYNETIQELHGLIMYWYDDDFSQSYELSKNDIEKISYIGEIDFYGCCLLEEIIYSCDLEAFDVLLDRKASNSNLCICEVIEAIAENEINENIGLFEDSINPMFHLILRKFKGLVFKYKAHRYINYNSTLIDNVLCASSYEKLNNYIRTHYVDDVLKGIKKHKDYFKGIEISNDETNIDTYLDIQYDVVEKLADILIDKAIDAFCDWEIDSKLYFLLLVDRNGITPSKEVFKDFMDNPEAFTREMKLSQIIAA